MASHRFQQSMLVPADYHINARTVRYLFVFLHGKMRQRDHDLRAARMDQRHDASGGCAGIDDVNVRAGAGGEIGVRQSEAEASNLRTLELTNSKRRCIST